MLTAPRQYKCHTLQRAQHIQQSISRRTNIQPEIFKVRENGSNLFIVIEQPRKAASITDLIEHI